LCQQQPTDPTTPLQSGPLCLCPLRLSHLKLHPQSRLSCPLSGAMSWLFGSSKPKQTPKEQVREWSSGLKKEMRTLERERLKIEREEQKTAAEIKKLVKAGHSAALKTLAKSLVKSQLVRARMLEASTRINSVLLSLKTHAATLSVAEHMGKSAAVMKGMQSLVSLPELRATAKAMSQEMMRAGIIEEMVDDSMSMLDSEDIDAEADQEVDKVMQQVLDGTFGQVGKLKQRQAEQQPQAEEEEVDNAAEEAMKARLSNLHS